MPILQRWRGREVDSVARNQVSKQLTGDLNTDLSGSKVRVLPSLSHNTGCVFACLSVFERSKVTVRKTGVCILEI